MMGTLTGCQQLRSRWRLQLILTICCLGLILLFSNTRYINAVSLMNVGVLEIPMYATMAVQVRNTRQMGNSSEKHNTQLRDVPGQHSYKNETDKNGTNLPMTRIGILIPSTTRTISNVSLGNLSLVRVCLPSIYKTISTDFDYKIYIGIDKGDFLEKVKDDIKETFENTEPFIVSGHTFVSAVNAMAKKAVNDGMDYLVRVNDDTQFDTSNWTALAINILKSYKPANIGVVGPTCKNGKQSILTHDMVHRSHLEIFGFYYPPKLSNWWTDDWITEVYQPHHYTKMNIWNVTHISAHDTRYKVNSLHITLLKGLVKFGKTKLEEYLLTQTTQIV